MRVRALSIFVNRIVASGPADRMILGRTYPSDAARAL